MNEQNLNLSRLKWEITQDQMYTEINQPRMLITIIEQSWRKEILYGKQELTWIKNPRFFEISEKELNDIRNAPWLMIQPAIDHVIQTCKEILWQ